MRTLFITWMKTHKSLDTYYSIVNCLHHSDVLAINLFCHGLCPHACSFLNESSVSVVQIRLMV